MNYTTRSSLLPVISPVNSSPIVTKKSWTHKSDTLEFAVGLTEGNIIISKVIGNAEVNDRKRYFDIVDEIIYEYGSDDTKFVIIEDMEHLKKVTSAAKKYYVDEIKKRKEITAIIYFKINPVMKAGLKFAKNIHFKYFKIYFTKNLHDSLVLAEKFSGRHSEQISTFSDKCPYSGLEMIADAEYLDLMFSVNTVVSFRKIGDYILFCNIVGHIPDIDLDTFFTLKDRFIEKHFRDNSKFIEVVNGEESTGKATIFSFGKCRKYYSKYKGRLQALISCNRRLSARLSITLSKILNHNHFLAKSVKSVRRGVLRAIDYHNSQINISEFTETSFITNDAWKVKTEDGFECEIHVVPGKIFKIIASGGMTVEAANKVNKIQEMVLHEWFENNNSYYRVADYTNVVGGTVKGRYAFSTGMHNALNRFNAAPKYIFLVGANFKVKTQLKMAKLFWPSKGEFLDTTDDALQAIRIAEKKKSALAFFRKRNIVKNEETFDSNFIKSEVNRLVSYIASFSWDGGDRTMIQEFGRNELFKPIYDTLTVVKGDLDTLVDDREKSEKEMIIAHSDLVKLQNSLITEAMEAGKAEEANIAKTEFLSNMSHEIRTPMHGILNYARFGIKKIDFVDDEKLMHYFTTIRETSEKLLEVLNGLLDLSKLEAGKTRFNFEKFRIHDVLMTVIKDQYKLISEKGVYIKYLEPDFDDQVEIDVDQMVRSIENILENAIKFSGEGLPIGIEVTKSKDGYILVSIYDGGVGIPKEEREKIFGNFTQSSATYTGAGGTGLGLPISKGIVEGHHGTIEVGDSPFGGANFIVKIPIKQPEEKKKAA